MPLGVGREAPGEIVDEIAAAADRRAPSLRRAGRLTSPIRARARARSAASTAGRSPAEARSRRWRAAAQVPIGGKPQPLGAVVEPLRGVADQVLRVGEPAREAREMQPALG